MENKEKQKTMIEDFENYILNELNEVEGGNKNPLDLKLILKHITEFLESVDKQIKPLVQEEGRKWHLQDYNGFRIEYVDGAGRYSYDHIPRYMELKNEIKELEKMSQLALKQIGIGLIVNESTGELYEPAIFKVTEPYIKFTKKKEGQ